jgi:pyridine nucleotide-disulfide oxidoreductase
VQLSTGEKVSTRSLIWCVGVRADPLMDGLDLDTNRGRLVVDEFMAVPAAPDIYACGDCAAVPDLTRPGEVCGMTAQHAQRQGKQVARNVAATLGKGKARPYRHADLGFLVDLGGLAGAANPLHVPLSGPAANAVTRGYHLSAMSGNRMRGPDRLDPERDHVPRSDVGGRNQCRVRAARRRQTASITLLLLSFADVSWFLQRCCPAVVASVSVSGEGWVLGSITVAPRPIRPMNARTIMAIP